MPSGAPAFAICNTTSLVEVVCSSTRIFRPIVHGPSSARNFCALSRSVTNMGELERKIDSARRVGERTNRNVIDASRGNPSHRSEIDSPASFEFHVMLATEGDGFPHFRRFHVVE